MSSRIQLRRGTHAAWTAANPVLLAGEPGFETDTGLEKRGDGSTAWTSLGYTPANAPLNPVQFGAKFDGVTDDTGAWTAMFAALPAKGAEIYVPPLGTSLITQIVLPINSIDLAVRGGGSKHGGGPSCRLLSSYAGSGAVVQANGARGLRWEGVSIENSSATFTGKVLDISRGAGTGDTTLFTVKNCNLKAVAQAASAANLLQLTKATIGEIEDVYFLGGKYGVEGLTVGGDYCNAITVGKDCLFSQQDTSPIHNLGDQCRVRDATFEPLRSGAAGMYLQDAALPAGVILLDANWTGDVSAGGTWIVFNGIRLDVVRGALNGGAIGIQLNGTTRALAVATHFSGITTAIDLNGQTVNVFDPRGTSFADTMTTPVTAGATGVGQGGAGYYSALDAAQVVTNTTHALTSAANTAVAFDAANYQTNKPANWTAGTPTQLVARIPGLHRIYATVVFDASAAGERAVWFKLNNTTFLPGHKLPADASGNLKTVVQAATSRFLNVGDFIECYALQNSGGSLNVLVSDSTTGIPTTFGMELA